MYIYCFSKLIMSTFPFFFFNDTATTEIYTLSLHDALPIFQARARVGAGRGRLGRRGGRNGRRAWRSPRRRRSEEHTSELQSPDHLVCRLLLEKKKKHTRDQNLSSARLRAMHSRRWRR